MIRSCLMYLLLRMYFVPSALEISYDWMLPSSACLKLVTSPLWIHLLLVMSCTMTLSWSWNWSLDVRPFSWAIMICFSWRCLINALWSSCLIMLFGSLDLTPLLKKRWAAEPPWVCSWLFIEKHISLKVAGVGLFLDFLITSLICQTPLSAKPLLWRLYADVVTWSIPRLSK